MLLELEECENPNEGTASLCSDSVELAKRTLCITVLAALDNRMLCSRTQDKYEKFLEYITSNSTQ